MFYIKTNRTLQTCWYLGVAPGILKLRKNSLTCQDFEENSFLNVVEIWFDLIYENTIFFWCIWAACLKTALREAHNVSFSAHACEWIGLTQLLVPKAAAAAEARSCIFDIQLWFVFAAGSSYSPALPCLVEFRSYSSVLPFLSFLGDSTSNDWKKEGRKMVLLFIFI